MPSVATTCALALRAGGYDDKKQLAVLAPQKYALADYALQVCGIVRPGCESAPEQQSNEVDEDSITQMKDVVHTRGVKQRLEDDFALKIGIGEDGEKLEKKESEEEFIGRAILQLRKADVNSVIKLFDRVERNNRKALSTDIVFQVQREVFKKKVAADDAQEKWDDEEHGTFHFGSPESYAEFEDWCQQFEYRDGMHDFVCFGMNDVTRPGHGKKPDDGTFAGFDLAKIRDALHYFQCNSQPMVSEKSEAGAPTALGPDATKVEAGAPTALGPDAPKAEAGAPTVLRPDVTKAEPAKKTKRPDLNVIKAELAKWSPPAVVSSYRRLSLAKHPDKEGGSPEAFQELADHAKVLTEACAKFHGVIIKKGLKGKKSAAAKDEAKDVAKIAICAALPEHLKTAVSFFGFTQESFRLSSPAEIKKARQLLSAEKDRRDKLIQKEKEPDKLIELLQAYPEQQVVAEGEDLTGRSPKQLKTLCMDLCKAHYGSVYGHIQKLK